MQMASLTTDASKDPIIPDIATNEKTAAEGESLAQNIVASSAINQAKNAQDFAIHGVTRSGRYIFVVVADGHGKGSRCNTIAALRSIDWHTAIDDDDFMNEIIAAIDKLDTRGEGSTLSVIRITNHRTVAGDYGGEDIESGQIQCYWIGDSSIKIYENGQEIFKSADHNQYNKKDIKRVSETGNMRGIRTVGVWGIAVVDAENIKSVPGTVFDFGGSDAINMTHSLGHSGKTGKHFQTDTIMMDMSKSYKAVAGSDGLWDMCYIGDASTIGSSETNAAALVDFADKRWRQPWIHDNTHQKISGVKFPESNIDDICVAMILVKPFNNKTNPDFLSY